MSSTRSAVQINGAHGERCDEILTSTALKLVARLHRGFDATRRAAGRADLASDGA